MNDEIRYKLLKLIHDEPDMSQRQLAKELGISLGKVNYCINALIERGFVKARNFKNSRNKRGYIYILTPRGIEEKAKVTLRFFQRKLAEYEELETEIERLREELLGSPPGLPPE